MSICKQEKTASLPLDFTSFLQFLDHAKDAIFIADHQSGRLVYTNRKASSLTGIPAEALRGMHQSDLHPERYRDFYREIFQKAGQKTSVVSQKIHVWHKNGQEIPVEIHSSATTWNGIQYLIGIFRDARGDISENDIRFEAFTRHSDDMIHLNDLDGRIRFASDATKKILGYQPEDLYHIHAGQLIHPDDRETVRNDMTSITAGKSIPAREIRLRHKNGMYVDVEVKGFIVDNGEKKYIGAVIRDISERKKQEALQKQNSQELLTLNEALTVLIEKSATALLEQEINTYENIQQQIIPYLDRLESKISRKDKKDLLNVLRKNLENLTSSFPQNLTEKIPSITSRELEIATLIKQGKSTKEISIILSISPRTVECYRDSIRKKLGLKGKKINLRTRLISLVK